MSWIKDYFEAKARIAAATPQKETTVYTEEQFMARLKFFIGICLSLTLFGIVFVVLYSLIFVTQPLNAISPIDSKFFELIIPIATFLTGTLSGIMLASPGDKEASKQALTAANKGWDKQPTPVAPASSGFGATASSGFGAPASGFSASFNSAPAAGGFSGSFTAPSMGGFSGSIATTASGKKIVPEFPQPEL